MVLVIVISFVYGSLTSVDFVPIAKAYDPLYRLNQTYVTLKYLCLSM